MGTYTIFIAFATVCFCIAAICLIIAVIMFFNFDIRRIRKELSGKMVENYMDEYRKKKENSKRVGIYDPSGKLIDVKNSKVGVKARTGNINNNAPQQATTGNMSMGDALAQSRATASVKAEAGTQVLAQNQNSRKDFVILKDLVFTECAEYIG